MGDVSLDIAVTTSDDAIFREIDGEAVILNLQSGIYFGLNPVGTRIWQLLAEHGRLRTVFELMLAEFDAPPELLERDLLRLVAELTEKELVTSVGAPA